MPNIRYSKESLEGPPQVPDGMYELRLEGFEPELSKNKDSINLNPVMKIVNHAQHNGVRVYDNLNTKATWINEAFVHAFGMELNKLPDGSADMPGTFNGPEDDPSKWEYVGPLTGRIAKVMTKLTEYNGKKNVKVDQWLCSTPGCNQKHPQGLAK